MPIATVTTTQKHETNPIDTPACHPERRAAEQSAAAQSRGTCQITIAKGDSKQKTPHRTQKMRNKPNFRNSRHLASFPIPDYAKQTQFPYWHDPGAPGYPCNAKQTQFPAPNIHSTIYNPMAQSQLRRTCGRPKMRNKPNPCRLSYFLLSPFSSLAGNGPRHPIYPYPSLAHDPKIRNKPNLNAPTVNPCDIST